LARSYLQMVKICGKCSLSSTQYGKVALELAKNSDPRLLWNRRHNRIYAWPWCAIEAKEQINVYDTPARKPWLRLPQLKGRIIE